MKRIFRSIIDIRKNGRSTIEQTELKKNYKAFLCSNVEAEDPSYIKIYHWIEGHFRQYGEVPQAELIFERAQSEGDEGVMACLKDIVQENPYIGSNYRAILKEKYEDQNRSRFRASMEKAWQIANSGMSVGKGRKKKVLKGIGSAIDWFMGETRVLRLGSADIKTEINFRSSQEGEEFIKDYMKKHQSSSLQEGMYFLLEKIDDSVRGMKLGQLMVIAGFTGQGKTILSNNIAHSGLIQKLNGMYVTLEMSAREIQEIMYVLHANSCEWLDHPVYGKKYANMIGKVTMNGVVYGELNNEALDFFDNVVRKDLDESENYGDLLIWQPEEALTPIKLEQKIYDYHAQLLEEGKTLDYVIVDYVGLMVPDRNERYGDYNVDLNNMLKKLKNLAITFDNGRKLRVITPWQMNREGLKEALKNDGIYSLTALSNANETERSSDIIVSVFMTKEMKKSEIIKISCLKYRKGQEFSPFEAKIDFSSMRIMDFVQRKVDADPDELIIDIPLDT